MTSHFSSPVLADSSSDLSLFTSAFISAIFIAFVLACFFLALTFLAIVSTLALSVFLGLCGCSAIAVKAKAAVVATPPKSIYFSVVLF